jgi:hypothetical protein
MNTCGLNEMDFPRIRCASISYGSLSLWGAGWGEGSLAREGQRNRIVTIVTTRRAQHAGPFITPLRGFRRAAPAIASPRGILSQVGK